VATVQAQNVFWVAAGLVFGLVVIGASAVATSQTVQVFEDFGIEYG
jgi:hypothetical protein